jgi:hypothetical protein
MEREKHRLDTDRKVVEKREERRGKEVRREKRRTAEAKCEVPFRFDDEPSTSFSTLSSLPPSS